MIVISAFVEDFLDHTESTMLAKPQPKIHVLAVLESILEPEVTENRPSHHNASVCIAIDAL